MNKLTLLMIFSTLFVSGVTFAEPLTVKEYAESLKVQQQAINANCENDMTQPKHKSDKDARDAIKLYCACYTDNIVNNEVFVGKMFEVVKTATNQQEFVQKVEAIGDEVSKLCQSKLAEKTKGSAKETVKAPKTKENPK